MGKKHVEIIAEAGIGQNGDMGKNIDLIKQCKDAGADVVKFQLVDPLKRPDIDTHPYKDILVESRITKRQLYILNDECEKVGIEFMCSVFDVERVDWTEAINMKRYKIASKCVYDVLLCKKILSLGKEVIVSDGYIDYAIPIPKYFMTNWKKIKWLYCISEYPTNLNELEFSKLSSEFFKTDTVSGFSDHTIGLTASKVAMSLGAKIIEKHVTLDKEAEGPDHILSATPDELAELCQFRDDIEEVFYNERT